jgi:multiple sugar transport system substrate-binding protein
MSELVLPGGGPGRGLSRRGFLAGALGVGGLGLAGCAGPGLASGSQALVRQWNLFGGGDGARLIQMHDEFVAQHPDIAFKATTWAWGPPFYTKLAMSAVGGRAPEVATLHLSRLAGFSPQTMFDPVPMDLLADVGLSEDDFLPETWQKCQVNGELYAVPLDTHPYVMYFNTEICEQAGVLGPDGRLAPFQGPDALVDMLTAVKEVTGKLGVSVETTNPWRLWWTLYRQLDGEFFAGEGTDLELVIDDDKALEALTFIQRLSKEGLAPQRADYPACVANFSNGDAGILFNGEWEVTTYEDAELPFSMAPFPDVYGNHRCQADSHTFVLPFQRDRDPENTRATMVYIAWMLKNSVEWAAGGHIPAYQPVANSDEYLELKPQSEYRDVAEVAQYDPSAWFSGSGAQMQEEAGSAFEGVHSLQSTPEEALAQFKAAVQKLIDTPPPV